MTQEAGLIPQPDNTQSYRDVFDSLDLPSLFKPLSGQSPWTNSDAPGFDRFGGISLLQEVRDVATQTDNYITRQIEMGPLGTGLSMGVSVTLEQYRKLGLFRTAKKDTYSISFICWGSMGITNTPQGEYILRINSDGECNVVINKGKEHPTTPESEDFKNASMMIKKIYGIDIVNKEGHIVDIKVLQKSFYHLIAQARRNDPPVTGEKVAWDPSGPPKR